MVRPSRPLIALAGGSRRDGRRLRQRAQALAPDAVAVVAKALVGVFLIAVCDEEWSQHLGDLAARHEVGKKLIEPRAFEVTANVHLIFPGCSSHEPDVAEIRTSAAVRAAG